MPFDPLKIRKPQTVVVLGMHRSGTSLVARWLRDCGVTMYDLVGAGVGNEDGHFEDEAAVTLQSRMIAAQWPRSRGWVRHFPFLPAPGFGHGEKHCREYLRKRTAQSSVVWGWKDPRTCVFIHEWIRICPDLKAVVVFRPAMDVIGSMLARSARATEPVAKINAWSAVLTTWYYLREMLDFCRKHPENVRLFSIGRMVRDNREVFAQINGFLGGVLNYQDIAGYWKEEKMRSCGSTGRGWLDALCRRLPLQQLDEEFRRLAGESPGPPAAGPVTF